MKLKVLYEDNHLIAVFKPSGLLTQADKTGGNNLMAEVKKYLKEKYQKPGNVFLGLLHRLDKPVSGIVLFAKTSKGAARLSLQFRNQTIEKRYQALVSGKPKEKEGTLIHYLKKDENKKKALISQNPKLGFEKVELFYRIISSNQKYSLLEIKIKSGKFHQIRAQLSFFGHPVLGDRRYGSKFVLPDKSIALSAISLSFNLATKKERKELFLPIPSFWQRYIIEKK